MECLGQKWAEPPTRIKSIMATGGGRKRKAVDTDLEVEKLAFKDDNEFRDALKEVGIDAGPIDSSNRLARCIVLLCPHN